MPPIRGTVGSSGKGVNPSYTYASAETPPLLLSSIHEHGHRGNHSETSFRFLVPNAFAFDNVRGVDGHCFTFHFHVLAHREDIPRVLALSDQAADLLTLKLLFLSQRDSSGSFFQDFIVVHSSFQCFLMILAISLKERHK